MKKVFAIVLIVVVYVSLAAFSLERPIIEKSAIEKAVEHILKKQILTEAAWAMKQAPITVTAPFCIRSAGG